MHINIFYYLPKNWKDISSNVFIMIVPYIAVKCFKEQK